MPDYSARLAAHEYFSNPSLDKAAGDGLLIRKQSFGSADEDGGLYNGRDTFPDTNRLYHGRPMNLANTHRASHSCRWDSSENLRGSRSVPISLRG